MGQPPPAHAGGIPKEIEGGRIMTLQEFTDRTGFYPDWALCEAIKAHYIGFNGGMDSFCEAYKNNANRLAERIQHEANEALDRELEWKPCSSHGTKMSQDEYDELLGICTGMDGETECMCEGEAKMLIADEFGFSSSNIDIVYTVRSYEMNRHGKLRKTAEYERLPLYDSSDRNYIRFDVKCIATVRHYEMINGLLEQYQL